MDSKNQQQRPLWSLSQNDRFAQQCLTRCCFLNTQNNNNRKGTLDFYTATKSRVSAAGSVAQCAVPQSKVNPNTAFSGYSSALEHQKKTI